MWRTGGEGAGEAPGAAPSPGGCRGALRAARGAVAPRRGGGGLCPPCGAGGRRAASPSFPAAAMVWCGAVQSFLFEYDTPRIVLIRSRKVGLVNRGVQLAILAYVIG